MTRRLGCLRAGQHSGDRRRHDPVPTAAMNAARSKNSHLGARYRRLAARRSKGRALVAAQHTILAAIWNMDHTGALYDDLGADHCARIEPIRTKRRAIRQLGYTVTLQPAS